jgi:endonuclease/exonuclease/phosphatase family metal-dependent hydrolase
VSERARLEGSKLIIARLEGSQRDGAAAVVTGDFNTTPGSAVHRRWLEAGFADAHVAAGNDDDPAVAYTNHGWDGMHFTRRGDTPRRIDWILVRDGAGTRVSLLSCEIVRDAAPPLYPSDHYPVVAELDVASVKGLEVIHR